MATDDDDRPEVDDYVPTGTVTELRMLRDQAGARRLQFRTRLAGFGITDWRDVPEVEE